MIAALKEIVVEIEGAEEKFVVLVEGGSLPIGSATLGAIGNAINMMYVEICKLEE